MAYLVEWLYRWTRRLRVAGAIAGLVLLVIALLVLGERVVPI